jgi:hypothetical protein
MMFNAYVLDWTMDEFAKLKAKLSEAQFVYKPEGETEHIRVAVPFERVEEFGELCHQHLNQITNYVDIQYPARKTTVIVFQKTMHVITSPEEDQKVKAWAIALGLPPEQADWGTSY